MTTMRKLAVGAFVLFAAHPAAYAAGTIVFASSAGAHIDSDLMKGGGTDDTAVLQGLLDDAASGKAVHLVIDGPALVSGLNVYGNTTVECTAGGGLYLKDNSSRAIIRNIHRSRGGIADEHIEVRGCFLNGNRKNQPSANIPRPDVPGFTGPSNKEADGTFISGLQFLGVNYLSIKDVTLWNIRAFGALIGNANYVDIRGVIIDHGGGPNADILEFANADGIHFKGPSRYIAIDSVKIRTCDDGLAFNANDFETDDITTRNDFGPYVGQGPITDVTVSNVILMGVTEGIRILSSNERIDRLVISNVSGSVRRDFIEISHWINRKSFGNVGSVILGNIAVEIDASHTPPEWRYPYIAVDARIETLKLYHVVTNVVDKQPLLRMGRDTAIGEMDVDLTAVDPALAGNILQLDEGSRIDRLKFSLNWKGSVIDKGKNPIVSHGRTAVHLQWVDTPPMFVQSRAVSSDASSIDVEFNQTLKSRASVAGAEIAVNNRPVSIKDAAFRPNGMTIRYKLASPLRPNDQVTWSYDERAGELANLDGEFLHSVSEKKVPTPH